MKNWTCEIFGMDLISPNRLMRMHWATLKREKNKIKQLLAIYGSPIETFEGKVDMLIEREYGRRNKALDPDNLYGATKLLIDCLRSQSIGAIVDDTPEILRLKVTQKKAEDGELKIRVSITEREDPDDSQSSD